MRGFVWVLAARTYNLCAKRRTVSYKEWTSTRSRQTKSPIEKILQLSFMKCDKVTPGVDSVAESRQQIRVDDQFTYLSSPSLVAKYQKHPIQDRALVMAVRALSRQVSRRSRWTPTYWSLDQCKGRSAESPSSSRFHPMLRE